MRISQKDIFNSVNGRLTPASYFQRMRCNIPLLYPDKARTILESNSKD